VSLDARVCEKRKNLTTEGIENTERKKCFPSSVVKSVLSTKKKNVIEQEERRNGGRRSQQRNQQQRFMIRHQGPSCLPPFLRFSCSMLPFRDPATTAECVLSTKKKNVIEQEERRNGGRRSQPGVSFLLFSVSLPATIIS
jgi:hypothetical protein